MSGNWLGCKCANSDRPKNSCDKETVPSFDKNFAKDLNIKNDVLLFENFITEEEGSILKDEINKIPWKMSQSGRRKQDFGPKANFKKKKAKLGNFTGLPSFSKSLIDKMHSMKELDDFIPVEVCHLEYSEQRGASIDPHIDDYWLWGERLVTLSLCSTSILTLSNEDESIYVQIPMPSCSLLVLKGLARHEWKHAIRREDINGLRIAVTFRELSRLFTHGDMSDTGLEILKIAKCFDGKPLHGQTN
eukprot:gene14230-15715_t